MRKNYFSLWLLFLTSVISSGGEFWLALMFAKSSSVKADALHALAHSIWYFVGIVEYYFTVSGALNPEEKHALYHKFNPIYILIFYGSLLYVSGDAIWKLWNPLEIIPKYMVWGVGIGILGNIVALFILSGMNRGNDFDGHDKQRHSQFNLHAMADFWVSAVVLIYAAVLILIPPNQLIFRLDSILTLIVVVYISLSGYSQFFGHKHTKHIHHH